MLTISLYHQNDSLSVVTNHRASLKHRFENSIMKNYWCSSFSIFSMETRNNIWKYFLKILFSDTVMESKPSFDLRGTNSDSELSVLLSSRSVQRVYDPPADGSCFFHCIVKKLDLLKANSQSYTHLTLRHQTIGKFRKCNRVRHRHVHYWTLKWPLN